MKKFLMSFVFAATILSCSDAVYRADMTFVMSRSETSLQDTILFSGCEIVMLESDSSCIISNVDRLLQCDSMLYFFDRRTDNVIIFGANGRHIATVDDRGRGHNEYINLIDVAIDRYARELLLLVYPTGIMHYSLTGQFKSKQNLAGTYTDISCDSLHYYFRNETYANKKIPEWSVTSVEKATGRQTGLLPLEAEPAPFCSFGQRMFDCGRIYMVRFFDNIVYELHDGLVRPRYVIDFGKYSFPKNKMKKRFDCNDLWETGKRNGFIYALSKFKTGTRFCVFSSNLFDINCSDNSTGECVHAMGVEDTRLGYTWRDYVPVEGTPGRIAVMLQPEMLSAVREQMEKNPGIKTKIKKALQELAGRHGVSENPVLLLYTLR